MIGAASGSWLQEVFGDRGAFRALSYLAFVCSLIYAVAYYVFRRWRRSKEEAKALTEQGGVTGSPPPAVLLNLSAKKGFDNEAWVADE